MTLSETIRAIEVVAAAQPAVNMVVRNDIFRLNAASDARYGVFGWTQGQHAENVDSPLVTYAFTFFYIDRLTEDLGNQVEVQSVGISTLENVLRMLDAKGVFTFGDWNFTTFNQRFLDECAGVFCSVALQVPVDTVCDESYFDFNDDFAANIY